jgi:hypothetical protein
MDESMTDVTSQNYRDLEALDFASNYRSKNPVIELLLRLTVAVNKGSSRAFSIQSPGPFRLELDVHDRNLTDGCFHIEMKCNKTIVPARLGVSSVKRRLAFLLKKACVQPPSVSETQAKIRRLQE